MTKTHWRRCDYRIESLFITMQGLQNEIEIFKTKLDEIKWYDGVWYLEESEPIYGLAFIALQNYINSSIYDLEGSLNKKTELYKLDQQVEKSEKTRIELIIAIANYFKHRDDDKTMHKGTSDVLDSFGFEYNSLVEIENSPILKGLDLLSDDWDLINLIKIVGEWRESLWKEKE